MSAQKKKVVVLSGAGISAESGLRTFRDSDGYWKQYRFEQIASPNAWRNNREDVLAFYNERRRGVLAAEPNAAHLALAQLEKYFDVVIVTQNVDNLHERGGSSHVVHLHGEIMKARSTVNPQRLYDTEGRDINIGDKCEKGSQLRPHIVWFGEAVPNMDLAVRHVSEADVFIVVGTSLAVYPAASLVDDVPHHASKFLVAPDVERTDLPFVWLKTTACDGVPKICGMLVEKYAGR